VYARADGRFVRPLQPSERVRGGAVMEAKLDKQRTQEFARKLFGFYTSGVLTLMVDIGHRTGLFEAVAKGPGGSQEIAARARLSERYVREWLCALATGGVLEYDAASRTFSLPPEHAVCLTGTSSRNLAAASQGLPMLAARLARVVECFRNGGGVPYSEYRPDFTEFMDASWRLLYDGLLIKGFLPAAQGGGLRAGDVGPDPRGRERGPAEPRGGSCQSRRMLSDRGGCPVFGVPPDFHRFHGRLLPPPLRRPADQGLPARRPGTPGGA